MDGCTASGAPMLTRTTDGVASLLPAGCEPGGRFSSCPQSLATTICRPSCGGHIGPTLSKARPTSPSCSPDMSASRFTMRACDNLAQAVVARHRAGVAQGILMSRLGCSQDQAIAILKHRSQRTNRKLRIISDEVIRIGDLKPAPTHKERAVLVMPKTLRQPAQYARPVLVNRDVSASRYPRHGSISAPAQA